jgi:hypothetical protein
MSRLNTSNIYFDAEGQARSKATDEVLFDYAFEAQDRESGEPQPQKRLARTCLPKAAREAPNVTGRISPKLIAASVAKAKAAAARKAQ